MSLPRTHFRTEPNGWNAQRVAAHSLRSRGTGGPFTIGCVIHNHRRVGFTGWIGGVAFFDRALSPADHARLHALAASVIDSRK